MQPGHPFHEARMVAAMLALCWSAAVAAGVPAQVQTEAPPALLLAQPLTTAIDVRRYLVSEKLDGVRASWDGHTLRFRSGHIVPAPAWFLARLPPQPLDGELWAGRGRFEALSGWVRKVLPDDDDWRQVRYMIFELPGHPGDFAQRAKAIETLAETLAWPQLRAVPQYALPDQAALQRELARVVAAGGEGLMLHRADAPYLTGRSDVLLKLKPVDDAEAVVIAHQPGRGRHLGRLGALVVRRADGQVFRIGTGFSDAAREDPPPVGSTVTYSFRGLTRHGLPRFPSFWRVRADP